MFFVQLKFSSRRDQAAAHMEGHRAWLRKGFDDGVFMLAGSLQPNLGGGILAGGLSREDLQGRVDEDPFVAAGVVTAEIVEMTPALADARLNFLIEG